MPLSVLTATRKSLMFAVFAAVSACSSLPGQSAFLFDGHVVAAPLGQVALCEERSQTCTLNAGAPTRNSARVFDFGDLQRVNALVNAALRPSSDGAGSDKWSFPIEDGTNVGDCEDYALEKQKFLEKAGWPRERLRLAVVAPPGLSAHAILVVTTEKGDVVLDNLRQDIRDWRDTGYVFLKRQSASDDLVWYSIGESPRPSVRLAAN